MMEFRAHRPGDLSVLENLFVSVFTESENEQEGNLVGKLAKDLMITTDSSDLYGFVAIEKEQIVGAILFSRVTFENDINAFILAPVAVATDFQSRGIGQALINYGLQQMKQSGVKLVISYGDPNFYSKVGFQQISQETIQPPFELSLPHGWIAQSLTDDPIEKMPGRCSCVEALENPVYW